MATEEQKNQALISVLSASNSQADESTLIVPPNPPSVVATASSASTNQSTATIATLVQDYTETTLKLKSILSK